MRLSMETTASLASDVQDQYTEMPPILIQLLPTAAIGADSDTGPWLSLPDDPPRRRPSPRTATRRSLSTSAARVRAKGSGTASCPQDLCDGCSATGCLLLDSSRYGTQRVAS